MFTHGETVTVRTVTTTRDELGDTTEVVVEQSWGPCAVAPRYANESADQQRPALIVGLTIYGPTRTLDSDDELIIDGVTYSIDGVPGVWRSPFTGWEPGVEVAVKRTASV